MNTVTTYRNPGLDQIKPHGQSLMVKGLRPGLAERGKIKIGRKGEKRKSKSGNEFQMPTKLDHFIITTTEQDNTGNFTPDLSMMETIANATGQAATKILKVPVRLLFDDIGLNFQTRFASFSGKTLACSGDGETATRQGVDEPVKCTCHRLEQGYTGKDKCKINGRLQVMIDGADTVGGIWMFRTTSWNSVQGLISSMALIQSATQGKLSNLRLNLTLSPKTVSTPDGSQMLAYIVGLEYQGTMQELRAEAYETILEDAKHSIRIEAVQEQARMLIAAPVVSGDEDEDIAAEYYPDVPDAAETQGEAEPPRDLRKEMEAQSKPPADDDDEKPMTAADNKAANRFKANCAAAKNFDELHELLHDDVIQEIIKDRPAIRKKVEDISKEHTERVNRKLEEELEK